MLGIFSLGIAKCLLTVPKLSEVVALLTLRLSVICFATVARMLLLRESNA